MVHTLRHLIFRTWTTVLVGGFVCLLVLPTIHPYLGLAWALFPVAVILLAVFAVVGWASNRMGMRSVKRMVEEATKWERAGLLRSAEKAYRKAGAVLDSFLFSPLVKRRESAYLAARLARFYLAKADKAHDSEAFIISYLQSHPEDGEVAEDWLRQVVGLGELKADYYELASRIGEAQEGNVNVQHLLARLYLASRRTDFPALQTYREVLSGDRALASDIVRDLAGLFISEGRADEWALKVYLEALRLGGERSRLLRGISACVHWIGESERTKKPLQEAYRLLAGFDEARLARMRAGFNPPRLEPIVREAPRRSRAAAALWKLSKWSGATLFRVVRYGLLLLLRQARALIHLIRTSRRAQLAIQWSVMAVLVVGVGILVINTAGYLIRTKRAVSEKKEFSKVIGSDAFTIQVAAYLKPEDAQRYVRYLKRHGLDAYWTKRVGTKKTYYQVRVSHFPDKASARAYGVSLKARGIIDDFYVANYERP
jgi:hypothetical protein